MGICIQTSTFLYLRKSQSLAMNCKKNYFITLTFFAVKARKTEIQLRFKNCKLSIFFIPTWLQLKTDFEKLNLAQRRLIHITNWNYQVKN